MMRHANVSGWIGSRWAMCAMVLMFTFCGCGYTTRSLIAGKYRTIYITPFKNKIDITREMDNAGNYRIYRPRLESDVTNAVVQKFLTDGNLKPVEKPENADLVLQAELIDFRKDALRYTRNDDVEEYRVTLTVNMKLMDIAKDTLVFEEPGFSGNDTYFVSGAQGTSESSAVSGAITDLSRRIVERTVDQW